MPELLKQMRAATADSHKRLDSLPFHEALRARILDRVSITSFLKCLAVIHSAIENELNTSRDKRLQTLWNPSNARTGHLANDLKGLDNPLRPNGGAAMTVALELAHSIAQTGLNHPVALIGPLYVLEGSRNGGLFIGNLFRDCLGADATRLSYYEDDSAKVALRWKTFTSSLESIEVSTDETEKIVNFSAATFSQFEKMISALHPLDPSKLQFDVAAVNPEAGSHAMPQDPQLIDLAFAAGETAWARFPYLSARFAERGLRFTGSDSLWLVSLTALSQAAIRKNIFWLRAVLSTRGIPSLILETHMFEIQRRLVEIFPTEKTRFAGFAAVAAEIQNERCKHVADSQIGELSATFDPLFQSCTGYKITRVTELVSSAYADEANGIARSYAATLDWFLDSDRFSPRWIEVVSKLGAVLDAGKR